MIFLLAWFLFLLAAVAVFAHERRRLATAAAVCMAAVLVFELSSDVLAQKVAGHLTMPSGVAWSASFMAFVWVLVKERRYAWVAGVVFVLWTIAGSPWVGSRLMLSLQEDLPKPAWRTMEPFDAVLVLGGGTTRGLDVDTPQLSSSGDRVMLGARMWHAGKTRWLVTSGRELPGVGTRSLAADTETIWNDLAIPSEVILRLDTPFNTKGELEAFQALVAERQWRQLGIISSAYHLPRAMRHAKRLNLKLVPLSAQWVRPAPVGPLDLVVRRSGFFMVQTAVWEMVGQAVGR